MPNYNRADVAFTHGDGAYLFDTAGRRYLDFGAGIATSSLGHAHPHLVAAIAEQAGKVMHVSNLYRIPGAERLAQRYADAVRAAITKHTAAILIEPVQGEGGVRPAHLQFLKDLRATCDEFGILLALDEVQCGMGRTGKLFAHEWAGIEPDIISIAKGCAGGFPMGAVLAKEAVGKALVPGSHGTTFGGNPLACAAGNAVLDILLAPGFLDGVNATSRYLWNGLVKLTQKYPTVFTEVRGAGLILGLKCAVPNTEIQAAGLAEGILTVAAGENVVRLIPPLIIGQAECDEALALLDRVARRCLPSPIQIAAK